MAIISVVSSLDSLHATKGYVADLGRAIRAGRLLPGTELDLREAAEKLGTRRSLLRGVLRDLEAQGLLHVEDATHATVAPLDVSRLEHAFRLRRLIEVDMVVAACKVVTDGPVAELAEHVDSVPAMDWRHDGIYEEHSAKFFGVLTSVLTSVELAVLKEVTTVCDRAARIGFAELHRARTADLNLFTEVSREEVEAFRMRSAAGARETCHQFLDILQELSGTAFRAA
ncbi:GntR family transcriptional regulator [Pseudonocardia spinosispora]|uniref:GntR family transcriptional regulator n=1 Tax=Pseudonocardia spinosispora TaxID=103441 RepID=UPI000416D32D|nr:GntR family transcriptional regulator [Pseudonocardia spinosispora]